MVWPAPPREPSVRAAVAAELTGDRCGLLPDPIIAISSSHVKARSHLRKLVGGSPTSCSPVTLRFLIAHRCVGAVPDPFAPQMSRADEAQVRALVGAAEQRLRPPSALAVDVAA